MDTGFAYVITTILVLILAGILGSYCRNIFEKDTRKDTGSNSSPKSCWEIVIPGIVASFTVPLFLSVGKSEVFTNVVNGQHYAENIFIVFGFCLLAAVSARSFVNALARQALQKAEAAEVKAEEVKELVAEESRPAGKASELEKAQLIDRVGNFQGNDQEKLVLHALIDGDYVRRSITGIAKETGLDKREVRKVLGNLMSRGVVVEAQSKRTGGLLYQATLNVFPEHSLAMS